MCILEICHKIKVKALTFNDSANSLRLLIDQTWVSVDCSDPGKVWAWTFETKPLHLKSEIMFWVKSVFKKASWLLSYLEVSTCTEYRFIIMIILRKLNIWNKPIWYKVFMGGHITLNDLRLVRRGVSGSTFRPAAEKGVESHLTT